MGFLTLGNHPTSQARLLYSGAGQVRISVVKCNCGWVGSRKLQTLFPFFIKNKRLRCTSHTTILIMLFWPPNTEASSNC